MSSPIWKTEAYRVFSRSSPLEGFQPPVLVRPASPQRRVPLMSSCRTSGRVSSRDRLRPSFETKSTLKRRDTHPARATRDVEMHLSASAAPCGKETGCHEKNGVLRPASRGSVDCCVRRRARRFLPDPGLILNRSRSSRTSPHFLCRHALEDRLVHQLGPAVRRDPFGPPRPPAKCHGVHVELAPAAPNRSTHAMEYTSAHCWNQDRDPHPATLAPQTREPAEQFQFRRFRRKEGTRYIRRSCRRTSDAADGRRSERAKAVKDGAGGSDHCSAATRRPRDLPTPQARHPSQKRFGHGLDVSAGAAAQR